MNSNFTGILLEQNWKFTGNQLKVYHSNVWTWNCSLIQYHAGRRNCDHFNVMFVPKNLWSIEKIVFWKPKSYQTCNEDLKLFWIWTPVLQLWKFLNENTPDTKKNLGWKTRKKGSLKRPEDPKVKSHFTEPCSWRTYSAMELWPVSHDCKKDQ